MFHNWKTCRWTVVLVALSVAMLGVACNGGGPNQSPTSTESIVIKVDGSSTVFPITEAVAEEFQKTGKAKVTVGISGTGGGFKKFVRGETDISDASRPILTEEMAQAKAAGIEYIELPVAFDALTVVVNPQNDWVTSMTVLTRELSIILPRQL
jgi:phosphate transport system substrate-binding protein